jgi:transposase
MLRPTRRRTFAPRGETPIQRAWQRRDRLSALSAIMVSPSHKRLRLQYRLLPHNHNVHAEDVVEFLRQLKHRTRGRLSIIWDRGKVHDRSRAVQAYVAQHPEIATHRLPAYAPELNPDESVWGHIKYARLPNYMPNDIACLRRRLHQEFRLLNRCPRLLASFIKKSKLSLTA